MSDDSVSIRAAGVVPMRETAHGREVLAVHRPHRKDWSLPKGKVEGDEHIIVTATRECREETGVSAVLGVPLPTQIYPVDQRLKSVHYWTATLDPSTDLVTNDEVDEFRWVTGAQSRELLTYPHDADLVDLALATPQTSPLIILRHTQATKRSDFKGEIDSERPLSVRGYHQADDLVALLSAFDITRLHSSPARRCLETLQPYAEATGTEIQLEESLSEEGNAENPFAGVLRLGELLHTVGATVICTHRPVMPALMDGLGGVSGTSDWADLFDPRLAPGSFVVIHRSMTDHTPLIQAVERHSL